MARTSGAPKKAPNQGGKAPAVTQSVNAFNSGSGPSNTANPGVDVVPNTSGPHPTDTIPTNPGGYGG